MRFLCFAILAVVLLEAGSASAKPATANTTRSLARIEQLPGAPVHAALDAAMDAYNRAVTAGEVMNPALLTVIDYTRPSTEPRLWVIDLLHGKIVHRELVAHGRNSGENFATDFSNDEGSRKTSLGLFVTDHTYYGDNGYSLRLRGLDPGINDRAFERAIVMHGAAYVSDSAARRLGRLGRSWGCPAVRPEIARSLIDLIKEGTVLYAYGGVPSLSSRDVPPVASARR